jgi:hypothetical protein
MNAARHVVLTRQKEALRRERDQLLVDLAGGLGQARMAEVLGVTPDGAERLLQSACARLDAPPAGLFAASGDEITVRRLRTRLAAGAGGPAADSVPSPEQRRARQDEPRRSATRPPQILRAGAREDRTARWVDADSHYETLGSQFPDLA